MRVPRFSIQAQALAAGGTGGLLLLVLVLRLNPEVSPTAAGLWLAGALWFSWGAATCGLAMAGAIWVSSLVLGLPRPGGTWLVPRLAALMFVLAAVLSRLNADLHPDFLSGSGHRTLGQDAVTWLLFAVIVIVFGSWVGRRWGRAGRLGVVALVVLAPLLRVVWQPTPVRRLDAVRAGPLGQPSHPLLVVGVEGLDAGFLVAHASTDRLPTLHRLVDEASFGPLRPYQPYLRRSLWTTVAVGAYPRRHGVEARWGWRLAGIFQQPLRLLPWTPVGSEWVLPWWLAERGPPPPSLLPPLWERLRAAEVPTRAQHWPGVWRRGTPERRPSEAEAAPAGELAGDFRSSLELALAPFPKEREAVWGAILDDLAEVAAARDDVAIARGDVWIHLSALGTVRRYLAPLDARDTTQRAVLELALELLDDQLSTVVAAAGPDAIVAVVSPYGLAPPDSWERVLRLLGAGGSWRTSSRSSPDGLLVLLGPGVQSGRRARPARVADVAPTLCYLLGLPVAQYMDGRVVLEAVRQDYLAAVPLTVVD